MAAHASGAERAELLLLFFALDYFIVFFAVCCTHSCALLFSSQGTSVHNPTTPALVWNSVRELEQQMAGLAVHMDAVSAIVGSQDWRTTDFASF